jgi:hypothetical protein
MPDRHVSELRRTRRAKNGSILERHRAWQLRVEALELQLQARELRTRSMLRRMLQSGRLR